MNVGVPVRVHALAGDDLGIAHVPWPISEGEVLEFGGPGHFTMREYLVHARAGEILARRYGLDAAREPDDVHRDTAVVRGAVTQLTGKIVSPALDAATACQGAGVIGARGDRFHSERETATATGVLAALEREPFPSAPE